ncbi:MAG: cyanophycinase [Raineya sp.]|nr:cyanophycinase [Raineya sp.]
MKKRLLVILFFSIYFQAFSQKGKLFIIGGGKRPPELVQRMIQEAGLDKGGYAVIIPFASNEPDSAIFYAKEQFVERNIKVVPIVSASLLESTLDSVRKAQLIYFTGGDQNKLMKTLHKTPLYEAIWQCYRNGGTIAGTSAGAAVMSKKMITGNEKRYPAYNQTFQTIEAENIEFGEGMGFLEKTIIDQHFLIRSRHNRLLSAVIEFPEYLCVGIDEATAILVKNGFAEVVGISQVIVFENPQKSRTQKGIKIGAKNLRVSVYVVGEKFKIK